jgi:maltodextrin utilization protein YvdJ
MIRYSFILSSKGWCPNIIYRLLSRVTFHTKKVPNDTKSVSRIARNQWLVVEKIEIYYKLYLAIVKIYFVLLLVSFIVVFITLVTKNAKNYVCNFNYHIILN